MSRSNRRRADEDSRAQVTGALYRSLPRGSWARLSKRQRWQYALTAVLLCAFVVFGLLMQLGTDDDERLDRGSTGDAGGSSAPSALPAAGSALEALEAVEVKGRAPKTGYDRRAMFGDGWQDPDGNGCDARNDILQRDLGATETDHRCRVLSGVLDDPYTGTRIDFVRGEQTSQAVQIDHVVALSDAWQKGAQALTQEQRVAFANDPLNLIATDGPTNSSKGDADAASWLPPEQGYRCEYVARQVSVKAAYGLWMTQAEHDAIARVLVHCPDQSAYASDLAALVFME